MSHSIRRSSIMSSGTFAEESQRLVPGRRSERKGKLTIAVIALSNLFAWSCISLIAPFFPIEAAKKGTTETVVGMIYSCSELVIFLMSPVFGKLMSKYSPRFYYIAGLCVFGTCDVMFGWLNQSPSGAPFIAICFAVRIVEAIGTAAIMTASYAIAGSNYPDRIGTVYGILETVAGCGFLVGPALGGLFYDLGGFGLPFWALGSCVFICGCASCAVLPAQDCVEQGTGPSSTALLKSPLVWFGSICIVSSLLGLTVWSPVLAQHLQKFNLSQSVIGLIFITPAGAYTLTCPLWGCLLDRNVPPVPLIVIGLCLTSVTALFIGPAPFFTFLQPVLWVTVFTLTLMGFTLAPVIVSAMRCIVQGARDLGFKDESGTFGLVGGIVQSSNCFGTFVGPLLGGALTEQFGFPWTMVACAVALIIPVITFCPFLIHLGRRSCSKGGFNKTKGYVVISGENKTFENHSYSNSHH